MKCINCNSTHLQKDGNHNGYQRYKCMNCRTRFDYGTYDKVNEYIMHFNLQLKKQSRNKLTRENYCTPTNKPSYIGRSDYTDEWVKEHYEKCLKNYDYNMAKFKKLDHDDFDKYLMDFILKYDFKEVDDLAELKELSGMYIMVLDEYSQVYIGMSSNNIERRIIELWRKKIPFDRIVKTKSYESLIAIDSFGALDTTRIYYKYSHGDSCMDELEEIVNEFKKEYKLNRVEEEERKINKKWLYL